MNSIIAAETTLRQCVEQKLMQTAETLFEIFPDMESFGWHQYLDKEQSYRGLNVVESIEKPDISGAQGEYIIKDPGGKQLAVSRALKSIGYKRLIAAFGDQVEVAIYKDLTIEVEHDHNRSMAVEL